MKKFMAIAALAMLLTGCGVGTYSIQSGIEDASYISFTDELRYPISVIIDGNTYLLETVKLKAYKSGRDIRKTAENTIKLTPGQHTVSVLMNGNEIYAHKLFISNGETKIIEL